MPAFKKTQYFVFLLVFLPFLLLGYLFHALFFTPYVRSNLPSKIIENSEIDPAIEYKNSLIKKYPKNSITGLGIIDGGDAKFVNIWAKVVGIYPDGYIILIGGDELKLYTSDKTIYQRRPFNFDSSKSPQEQIQITSKEIVNITTIVEVLAEIQANSEGVLILSVNSISEVYK